MNLDAIQQLQRALGQPGIPRLLLGNGQVMQTTLPQSEVQTPPTPPIVYTYKVKIINPLKKSEVTVRYLNSFKHKFDTVIALRMKLIEAFSDSLPNTTNFTVGYYEGSQQAKIWLVTSEDLRTMYENFPQGGSISLWCDGKTTGETDTRKHKSDLEASAGHTTKRQEKESAVDDVYQELLKKHSKDYDTPKLRLWSRMICSGIHDDYDNPQAIPAFSSSTPKRRKRETLSEALTEAAVVFAESFSASKTPNNDDSCRCSCQPEDVTNTSSITTPTTTVVAAQISPQNAVDLRMKNYEQLRYLQQLFNDGILDEQEFVEQKANILEFFKKLKNETSMK